MNKDFSESYKAYTVLSEQQHPEPALELRECIEDITFGYYDPNGGTSGEMSLIWEMIGGESTPHLKCYDDGFAALATFEDVISILAKFDNQHITPKQFCVILDKLGFRDETSRATEVEAARNIKSVEELLKSIQDKAKEAHEAKDIVAMGIFTEILAAATPIVQKAIKRIEREERARNNKALKELRAKQRSEQQEGEL